MIARERLRRFRSLPRGTRVELGIGCALHVAVRAVLAAVPLKSALRLGGYRLPLRRTPLAADQVAMLARWSTRICRGTCLSESVVASLLAARHGHDAPLTIGVLLEGGQLRAHAWTGSSAAGSDPFAPIWPRGRQAQ